MADTTEVTVVYDVQDIRKVNALAKKRGVEPSDIYREALKQYLAANGL